MDAEPPMLCPPYDNPQAQRIDTAPYTRERFERVIVVAAQRISRGRGGREPRPGVSEVRQLRDHARS